MVLAHTGQIVRDGGTGGFELLLAGGVEDLESAAIKLELGLDLRTKEGEE